MTTKRRLIRSSLFGLACALLLFAPCATGSSARVRQEEVKESVLTGAGSLDIVHTGGEDDLKWELRLGKKKILDMEDNEAAHFIAHFPQLEMGEVVVLASYSGGTACPAQFQVVRITGPTEAQVSDEFGDCSDSPTITLKQLPDEEILFGFPGYYQLWQEREPGFRRPPPTTYVYKKGVLKELKATPTTRRGK